MIYGPNSTHFKYLRMVVGLTSTYAIRAYHHWCCEFEFRSGRGVEYYVIKFVSDLRQVGGCRRFPSVESGAALNTIKQGIKLFVPKYFEVIFCFKNIFKKFVIYQHSN
jgi:hypothetical protein